MMTKNLASPAKSSLRKRADSIKPFICKNLIVVLENPSDIVNIATVIRNVNALGAEKIYIIDEKKSLPDDWQVLRTRSTLSKVSVSASKWTFVKRFNSTEECIAHLNKNKFLSYVTSPHVKGKINLTVDQANYTKHKKLAIWFGNESQGISNTAVQASLACLSIPMYGIIESLNLGTSTGIVLYEATKQRRQHQLTRKKRKRHE